MLCSNMFDYSSTDNSYQIDVRHRGLIYVSQIRQRRAVFLCFDYMTPREIMKLRMVAIQLSQVSQGFVFWVYMADRQERDHNNGRYLFISQN